MDQAVVMVYAHCNLSSIVCRCLECNTCYSVISLAQGLNTAQIASLCLSLKNVKLPPKVNKRGRPKGAEKFTM